MATRICLQCLQQLDTSVKVCPRCGFGCNEPAGGSRKKSVPSKKSFAGMLVRDLFISFFGDSDATVELDEDTAIRAKKRKDALYGDLGALVSEAYPDDDYKKMLKRRIASNYYNKK